MMKKDTKFNILFYLIFFISGFTFIGLLSNRFQYEYLVNDYIGFSKSIIDGKILYKDLIDHKGPYLYIPYIIISLISRKGFAVYNFFTYFGGCALFYTCFLYVKKYLNDKRTSLLYSSMYVLLMMFANRFWMSCPFFNSEIYVIFVLFWLFDIYFSEKDTTNKDWLLIGFFIAVFVFMKYPLILFIFPFCVWFSIRVYSDHGLTTLGTRYLYCIIGMILGSIPACMYLYCTNGFAGAFDYYFFCVTDKNTTMMSVVECIMITALVFLWLFCKDDKTKSVIMFGILYGTCSFASCSTFTRYTHCICFIFLPIYICNIRKGHIARKENKVIYAIVAAVIFMDLANMVLYLFADTITLKDLKTELNIKTNNEVLYICEDIGLGSDTGEGSYYLQWIGFKYYYDIIHAGDTKSLLHNQLAYIENQETRVVIIWDVFLEDLPGLKETLESNNYYEYNRVIVKCAPYRIYLLSD